MDFFHHSKVLNRSGLGLIQLLISVIIGALVVIGVGKVIMDASRQQVEIKSLDDLEQLKLNIKLALETCDYSFPNKKGKPSKFKANKTNIVRQFSINGKNLIEKNQRFSNGMTVKRLMLKDTGVPVQKLDADEGCLNKYHATLQMEFTDKDNNTKTLGLPLHHIVYTDSSDTMITCPTPYDSTADDAANLAAIAAAKQANAAAAAAAVPYVVNAGENDLGQFTFGSDVKIAMGGANDYGYAFYDGTNLATPANGCANLATGKKYSIDPNFNQCAAVCLTWVSKYPDQFCAIHSRNFDITSPAVGKHEISLYTLDHHGFGCAHNSNIYVKEPGGGFMKKGNYNINFGKGGDTGQDSPQYCKGKMQVYWESLKAKKQPYGMGNIDKKKFVFNITPTVVIPVLITRPVCK